MKLMCDYNILDAFNFAPGIYDVDGIIQAMTEDENVGAYKSLIMGLDNDYLFSHGQRCVSRYVAYMLADSATSIEQADGHRALNEDGIHGLESVFVKKYDGRLRKIFEVLNLEYNPLENYNGVEEHSGTDSNEHYGEDYARKIHNEQNSKIKAENQGTDNDTNVFGFNSTTAVPESTTHIEGITETSGSKDDNYSDVTESMEGKEKNDIIHGEKIEKHGNLGITTSQQMVMSEIDLRVKNDFIPILYSLLDEFLGIQTFTDGQSSRLFREL